MEIILQKNVIKAIKSLYNEDVNPEQILVQATRKEFTGDLTVNVFPFIKQVKRSPEIAAEEIGKYLKENLDIVDSYNVIKGFLNISISSEYWLKGLYENKTETAVKKETVVLEFSSPNTNKPLHLGHVRNNLLGESLARILLADGFDVKKVNLVNDRGIHICKSMLAWQKWGNGITPETSGKKGDKLVGDFYVLFDKEYKKQQEELISQGLTKEEAENKAPLILEAREMLLKWENDDKEVISIWKMMNRWVYAGFDITYRNLDISFDKIYYESETYKLGKDTVLKGIQSNVLIKKSDGSVWADLTENKLDEKLLLRSDGTSVYMTQDIGTAEMRYNEYKPEKMIYVVGNEQIYHFNVLKIVLEKLGFDWAKNIVHFSYGMVELPEGKMKSREGTVVDADDLIDEMVATAREMSTELGKLEDFSSEEKENILRIIGLGALKYFILKVDPKKNMVFNPKESIDFNGNTGPFIQYTYARINSLKTKADDEGILEYKQYPAGITPNDKEISLIKMLRQFESVKKESAQKLSPAIIANYAYDLAKEYNQFYHDFIILKESGELRNFRLYLSEQTGRIIKEAMWLLGIEVPVRM
ncbi:MAG: arginine--tRNA ligase [Bacteroidetes bacterium GWF2_38_335]|nr:MAG: arginine--tRNA ligase [Bacteroidetes bacterium GWF2_38_335]OFY80987.1 MAG: arginine--tRNA ligase [Bacteroidetes bacterium RIFOXYA12_FULL_38_20]HBS85093.1 arginine--tRNA ligase [Bacteroidales bacterium]